MAKNLVIVESPAKAKTIEKFLGKDFKVVSSYGHIRDLSSKNMGIDIDQGFQPDYVVSPDKKDLVKNLKKDVKSSETVWLATDEDREGEAIAWHLAETLKLDPAETKRIVFHEITKTAIQKAIESPRTIDQHLVNAQQARRVLDRLVGFEVSPVLWRKVKQGLSAGRVQSVAVRLIVEREREIQNFTSKSTFRVTAVFTTEKGEQVKAELPKRFNTEEEAQGFLKDCAGKIFEISNLETKPAKKSPAPPFTTSTLQQEASRKLGYSVSQTMMLAQRLYESGKITYMRTDSLNLSKDAIQAAKGAIEKNYGGEFSQPRTFATKAKGAQEAHEAIRPTNLLLSAAGDDAQQKKLYDLIWKRTIASQMADAKFERTTVTIGADGVEHNFQAKGEVITFEGFLKVYLESTDDDEDQEEAKDRLPAMKTGQNLKAKEILATQRFSKHPPRYTEASLVRKLEELGIGRPSTYAPTISTIQKRQYVTKSDLEGTLRDFRILSLVDKEVESRTEQEKTGFDRNKLIPTDIGMVVNDFLVDHFQQVLDYHFTAKVEEEFDKIAEGQQKWNAMIEDFYGDFHKNVESVKEHSERATGERLLGTDPKTGKNVYVRIGRYGPMAQIGEASDEEKPLFAGLTKNMTLESATLEDVLDLFKLPRDLGEFEDAMVQAGRGRFGPFVKHKSKFVSIGKRDPLEIELDEAIELIEAKRKADAEKFIASFEGDPEIQILNGRWGPYIKVGRKNVKIPKDTDPKSLSREDAEKLIEDAKKAPKRAPRKKKS